jgi:hypothetical protein
MTHVADMETTTCRRYVEGELMIECDGCQDWFHPACVGLSDKFADKIKQWKCVQCTGGAPAAAASRGAPAAQSAASMHGAMPTAAPATMSASGMPGMPMAGGLAPREMLNMSALGSSAAVLGGSVPGMNMNMPSPAGYHSTSLPGHMAYTLPSPTASMQLPGAAFTMGSVASDLDAMQMDPMGMINWGAGSRNVYGA